MATPTIERREQMFPRLTPAQIARVSSVGHVKQVKPGDMLFEPGDQNLAFYVVIDGAVEILRPIGDGQDALREETVVVHGPGEFTGEINMLSARRSLVRGKVIEAGSVVMVDRADLRTLVQRDSE